MIWLLIPAIALMLIIQIGVCLRMGWLSIETIGEDYVVSIYWPSRDQVEQHRRRRQFDIEELAWEMDQGAEAVWKSFRAEVADEVREAGRGA